MPFDDDDLFDAPTLRKTVRGAEKLKGVQPDLINHWNNLQGEFDKAGLSAAIKSGFRTAEQQNSLHRRGYPTKGNDGYIKISPHQEGRALDISFSAAQKPRGREIISAYAKAHGLYQPSDEPWHIAIPKAGQKAAVVDDDLFDASAKAVDDDLFDAPSVTKSVTKQPSAEEALKGLMADATRRTSQIKPIAPKPVGMGDVQQASREEQPVITGSVEGLKPSPSVGYGRYKPPMAADPRDIQRVQQHQEAEQAKQHVQYEKDKPEIDRLAKEYRKAIKAVAPAGGALGSNWLAEAATKGTSGLTETLAGVVRASKYNPLAVGAENAADALNVHAQAMQQAAMEEGADRNAASKFANDVVGGFIGSAPELAAMGLGLPAPLVFGVGSGTRAYGGKRPVAPAVAHGAATGAAFEAPIEGALAKSLGVGATTAGIDLAAGATPKEALQSGATNALMVGVPHLMKDGVPEKPSAMQAQLEARGYTLVPEGTQRPPMPRGTRAERTPDGVVYYDPQRIDAATIRNTPTQELLGHVQPKDETTTETVVARDKDGSEIQSSAVSPENVEKQAEVMQAQYPEAKVETGDSNLAQEVIAERVLPQRYYHKDFGEVVELAEQSGAKQGRVKVAEVDDAEKIHYVKRADLSGKGNQRLVPIKTEPLPETKATPPSPESAVYGPSSGTDAMLERVRTESAAAEAALSPEARAGIEVARAKLASEAPETKGEKSNVIPTAENVPSETVDTSERAVGTSPSTKPDFVQAAIERKAARDAAKGRGERLMGSGADPYELIDNIIIKGHELYTEKVKPTFDEWKAKLRDEFGKDADKHLNKVWAQLHGEKDVTSARKLDMAGDRAELDLPHLPDAERKGWQVSLDNAQEKGYDKSAVAIAHNVLERPRALDDEQTAGLVLKAQQVKNDHAAAMERIANENDPEKLRDLRAETEMLQDDFDVLSDALKQSGSAKGRSLAIQKLTINQDYSQVALMNRYKQKVGRVAEGEAKATIEKQAGIIKDLETRLAERDERLRSDEVSKAADKIRRDVARETRQQQRVAKKGDLDAEATQLKQLIAAAWKKGHSTGVQPVGITESDVEFAKLVLKLARNRVKANLGLKAAELVDQVHGFIEDVADIDKKRVAEIISGYGKPKGRQSDVQRQLNSLKTELRQGLAAEDVAAGRRTAKTQGPKLSEAPKQGPKITDAPKQGPRESWPARKKVIEKQIAELERKTSEREFGPKPKRGATVYDDPQSKALMEQLGRAKLNYERNLRKWEAENRSKTEKVADLLIKWGRAAKLSYTSTLGKLGSAATGRVVMSPIENLLGEIPHRLMPKLSAKATTEGGGFSKAAEVAALWKSGRFKQVWNQLRHGASDLDLLYGPRSKMLDKEMSGEGILGVPGRVHGAMKEYPRQAEFDRQFVKVLKAYEKQGRDITQPSEQIAARMEAFNAAERARFQQRNAISDTFNSAMGGLERKGLLGKGLSKTGRFLFPITRVPVNVASETLNYSFGIPRAAIETAIRGGVKNMTPEQANNVMRAYKKGGVGLAMMTYAFLNPQQFGGYYQPNDKRKPDEPKPGEMMFFGIRIPKALTHIPILEAGQLAATARRVFDKLSEKGASKSEAILGGTGRALEGVAEGVPFYETPARFFTGKEGPRGMAETLGEQTRGMIPGFIQEGAKALDKGPAGTPAVRRPSGSFAQRYAETIKVGVSGLRQTVPISNVFGTKATKASEEAQRLSVPMVGAVRDENESPEDFAVREKLQNANIRTQLENVVAMPDYDKATDERKAKWLKYAAEFASAQTRKQIPAKPVDPNKTEEAEFAMPESPSNQSGFSRAYPADALDRFERMNAVDRVKVRPEMRQKARILLNDPRLSDEQKAAFKVRLDALGLTVRPRTTTRQPQAIP